MPLALEFVIHLITNNELILKKIGEKINILDESAFQNLNQLMEIEKDKDIQDSDEEDEDNE